MKQSSISINPTLLSVIFVFLFSLNLSGQEICNNGIDDDGDNLIDLNDDECICNNEVALTFVNGTLCRRLDMELQVNNATIYQWYKDGIAVEGENDNRLSLTRWVPDVEGSYQVYAEAPGGCVLSEPYHAEMIEYHTDLGEISLCRGDTVWIGNFPFHKEGIQRFKTVSAEGCDSTILFQVNFIDPTSERIIMTLCEGTTFTSPGGTIVTNEPGTYEEIIKSVSDCDSILTTYRLEFSPNMTEEERIICAGDTLVYFDIMATESGNYQYSFIDDEGCVNNHLIYLVVEDCTSTVTELEQSEINIFPNPISKDQSFSISSSRYAQMNIVDKVGRSIKEEVLSPGLNTISIDHLEEGIYFCLIKGEGHRETYKLIVQE